MANSIPGGHFRLVAVLMAVRFYGEGTENIRELIAGLMAAYAAEQNSHVREADLHSPDGRSVAEAGPE
jgi:hypothetical protein